MRTNFFCTNLLNTPKGPGDPGKIPGTSQVSSFQTRGRQTLEESCSPPRRLWRSSWGACPSHASPGRMKSTQALHLSSIGVLEGGCLEQHCSFLKWKPRKPRSNKRCFLNGVFQSGVFRGWGDWQWQKASKCLKTLVFLGILCPSERVYLCRKPRPKMRNLKNTVWKTPFGKHRWGNHGNHESQVMAF